MTQKTNSGGQANPGLLADLLANLQLAWNLMLDSRVSSVAKIGLPLIGLAYLIFPIDLLPDVVPVLGQLDEVALFLVLVKLFITLAPPEVVAEYKAGARPSASANPGAGPKASSQASGKAGKQQQPKEEPVIDAEYRVMNDA